MRRTVARRRKSGAAAVAALTGIALAGCGGGAAGEGDASSDSARDPASAEAVLAEMAALPYDERIRELESCAAEEGAVFLYGQDTIDMQQAWVNAFNEQYPDVEMQQFRQKPEDLVPKIESEARAGRNQADVILVNSVEGASLIEKGLAAKHSGAPIPPEIPEEYVEDMASVFWVNPNAVAWNTNLVPAGEEPSSLDELLEPKWRGKVSIDVGPLTFVAALIEERGEDSAREYLEDLIANEAQVRSGHTVATNALAAGEFPVAIELYAYKLEEFIANGAPIEYLLPDPTAAGGESLYISSETERPCAAALLFHWLLSEDGGQVTADSGRPHVNPNVTLQYPAIDAFRTVGTPEQDQAVVVTSEIAARTNTAARSMVEELIIPRLSQ